MDTQTLQTELLELLTLLHTLNPLHLSTLCQFLQHGKEDLKLDRLTELVRGASPALIDKLVAASVSTPSIPSLGQEEYPDADEVNIAKLPKEVVNSFGLLLQLYQLYQLLNKLSILQLMKIFEFVPPAPQVQQLQLMQQLQQLLGQLLPETLLSLHQELEGTQPGNEQQVLAQLLQLRKEHFHLYQPLRMLLQLDSDELLALQDILPKLQPTQMLQLLALLQLQPFDVLELKRVLQVRTTDPETDELGLPMPKTPIIQPVEMVSEQPSSSSSAPKRPLVRIVEQPPEKSVYKRNLKPNPTVQLVEDDNNMEPNLYIAPVLIRCDTLEEKPKLMTGNKPVKVAPGRVVTFRRLKITSTSHQQGESLFAIKFELRRYQGNEYEILDFVQSNPICVLSHSTQLKPASSTTATVTEVIPYSGSTMGGTRVAVLGNNFVDSPSSRVRFDNIDVIPIFHGPRTLICTTPQHQPGIVSVRVSNDSKLWSPTSASFTYEDRAIAPSQTQAIPAPNQFDLGLDIASSICEAAWQGGYEMVRDVGDKALPEDLNLADSRGYTPLHYAAALGQVPVASYLLGRGACPDARDIRGNAPLHWAVTGCHVSLVQLLLRTGANVDLVNDSGECALHLAASLGCQAVATLLLQHGAAPSLRSLEGDTPLHRAAALGHTSIVTTLLEHGTPIDSRDRFGETPLDYAVREECQVSVECLLAHGADPWTLHDRKEGICAIAVTTGNYDILQLLLKAAGKRGLIHGKGEEFNAAILEAQRSATMGCDKALVSRSGVPPACSQTTRASTGAEDVTGVSV